MDNDELFCEQPEPYEDDLETFERDAVAADDSAERQAAEEVDEDESPNEFELIELLRSEFLLLHHRVPGEAALEQMAHLLANQEVDFGEIGITACAIGWIAHAEAVRHL
jgi:hypothetical protein